MISYMNKEARRSLDGLPHSNALFVVERRGLEPRTLCLQSSFRASSAVRPYLRLFPNHESHSTHPSPSPPTSTPLAVNLAVKRQRTPDCSENHGEELLP